MFLYAFSGVYYDFVVFYCFQSFDHVLVPSDYSRHYMYEMLLILALCNRRSIYQSINLHVHELYDQNMKQSKYIL